MRTKIIAAFPGVGKTHYHKLHPETTLDSDSSQFSWLHLPTGEKYRQPGFPRNYIEHIKGNIGKYEIIFVSTHKEVRDALQDNCLFFYLMYPTECLKETYLKRYRDRGSPQDFIDLIDKNWLAWIRELRFCEVGCKQIPVFMSIEDEIRHINAIERGEE